MESATSNGFEGAGGFIQPSLPSPAPTASTVTPSHLPEPRSHPLRAGSVKETTVINHIDKTILAINRKHAKKFSSEFADQELEAGYESFKEVAKDIEGLVDVLWVSGTPSLQIPYLISLAGLVNSYLPDYPFSPKATFRLIRKLDRVFASLLLGEEVDSGVPLSGFEGRSNVVSMTEKVRIKSLAESCRVAVVEASDQDEIIEEDDEDDNDLSDDDDDDDDMHDVFGTEDYDTPGKWEMETGKVYERTIELLGDELGAGEFCDTIDNTDNNRATGSTEDQPSCF